MDRNRLSHIADLRTEALRTLEGELVEEFTTKRTEELTVRSVADLTEISTAIQSVRQELSDREADEPTGPSAEELEAEAAKAVAAIELTEEAEAEEAEAEVPTEELARKKLPVNDNDEDDRKESAAAEDTVTAGAEVELTPAGLESSDLRISVAPAVITAGADIPSIAAGSTLPDMRAVANAFIERRRGLRGTDKVGDGDDVIVASVRAEYPEDRRLGSDAAQNMHRIDAVASPSAIVASGGLCAPLEPYYGIQVISQASRPVRDALPKFNADRGGVRFLPPPVLTDLADSIGVTTANQDAGTYGTGEGDTPFKPCLHVTCPEEQTVEILAVHRCLTFGNFAARTYPEQVEAWLALSIAAHARRAETLLLDAIDAASTATTAAGTYSAVRSLLPQVDQAIAAYRNRHRTADNLTLRILLPAWTRELVRADLARSFRGNDLDPLYVTDAQIDGWFTSRGVNPTFYIDGPTGANQVFGAQAPGALDAFPSTVVWYLFVEGSFVFLDGGVLDLGLVRDSTLNKTNDYQIFAETFEAVAFYGIESIKVTSTVCPNGVYAPAATASAPC